MMNQSRELVAPSKTDSQETDVQPYVQASCKQEHGTETKFQAMGTCENCHRLRFGMN